MRILCLISLLFSIQLLAESHLPPSSEIAVEPYLKQVKQQLTTLTGNNQTADNVFQNLGFSGVKSASQSNLMVDDTWLSEITLTREHHGIFKLLAPPSNKTFFAPQSTDIALQASLDLTALHELILEYHRAFGREDEANEILGMKIGGVELSNLLQNKHTTLQLCIDFDDTRQLPLGKENIGYPHFALRIDGCCEQFEQIVQHYMQTRNALFTRVTTESGSLFTLPAYFSEAIAGYLPVIAFNTQEDSTTIASSADMLKRLASEKDSLALDPEFIETWESLPLDSSCKLYVSKRAVEGFHHFYKLSLKERWTDNPSFLAKKFQISAAAAQLNSSKSGLAFTLSSEENSDTITAKSPFPSSFILWVLKTAN
ncbi:hypothetical protein [Rubritalea sp.]|uniref:hypothetical protein n=1 Tax=Rubritalea sp. TaxID=2109375 RepID=UPI003EF3917B